jgi:hypothetical protein
LRTEISINPNIWPFLGILQYYSHAMHPKNISNQDHGRVPKKKLRDMAIQNKLIHERDREDNRGVEYSEQAGFMALNKTLIEPLRSWRFITVEKVGSHHVVSLTDEGRDALRFLRV